MNQQDRDTGSRNAQRHRSPEKRHSTSSGVFWFKTCVSVEVEGDGPYRQAKNPCFISGHDFKSGRSVTNIPGRTQQKREGRELDLRTKQNSTGQVLFGPQIQFSHTLQSPSFL
jgi:hypothetical protein